MTVELIPPGRMAGPRPEPLAAPQSYCANCPCGPFAGVLDPAWRFHIAQNPGHHLKEARA